MKRLTLPTRHVTSYAEFLEIEFRQQEKDIRALIARLPDPSRHTRPDNYGFNEDSAAEKALLLIKKARKELQQGTLSPETQKELTERMAYHVWPLNFIYRIRFQIGDGTVDRQLILNEIKAHDLAQYLTSPYYSNLLGLPLSVN